MEITLLATSCFIVAFLGYRRLLRRRTENALLLKGRQIGAVKNLGSVKDARWDQYDAPAYLRRGKVFSLGAGASSSVLPVQQPQLSMPVGEPMLVGNFDLISF